MTAQIWSVVGGCEDGDAGYGGSTERFVCKRLRSHSSISRPFHWLSFLHSLVLSSLPATVFLGFGSFLAKAVTQRCLSFGSLFLNLQLLSFSLDFAFFFSGSIFSLLNPFEIGSIWRILSRSLSLPNRFDRDLVSSEASTEVFNFRFLVDFTASRRKVNELDVLSCSFLLDYEAQES